jgi:ATP adenylyltransferase
MDKLWSPWRSQYIESFKDKEEGGACIFCETKEIELASDKSLKVFEGENCFVMLNLYPYNNGHMMVVPCEHMSEFTEMDDVTTLEMNNLLKLSIKALKRLMKPHGFNIGANLGKAAGAGIEEHIHFHIVPRWNGDTNFMPTLGKVKVISQDLLITKRNLIAAYTELLKEGNNISK